MSFDKDILLIAAEVHREWMALKQSQGIHSRLAEDGEELMKPFDDLSQHQKQADIATAVATINAMLNLGIIETPTRWE